MNFLEVPDWQPVARVVAACPRCKNDDLSIVTIHPLPVGHVTFHAIQDVVSDFLIDERG